MALPSELVVTALQAMLIDEDPPETDGAAFGLLIRLADVVYVAGGVWLVVHYGMSSLLKKAVLHTGGAAADGDEGAPSGATPAGERR